MQGGSYMSGPVVVDHAINSENPNWPGTLTESSYSQGQWASAHLHLIVIVGLLKHNLCFKMRNLFHYTKIDHMPDGNESAEAFLRRDSDSGESTDTKEITPKREDKLGQNVSMYLFIQVILLFCNIVFCGTNLYLSTKKWCPYGINGPNLVTSQFICSSSNYHRRY